MSRIISYGLKDCHHLQIVSVITAFDCDGNIKPLYVRIGEESLKVYNAYQYGSTFHLLNFHCEVIDGEKIKPLKLSYHINDHLWSIPTK